MRIVAEKEGCLLLAEAEGHAGMGGESGDPVCAAVSVLFRTTASLLEAFVPTSSARSKGKGTLQLAAGDFPEESRTCLFYATEFLKRGIGSLAEEFPNAVSLRVETAQLGSLRLGFLRNDRLTEDNNGTQKRRKRL